MASLVVIFESASRQNAKNSLFPNAEQKGWAGRKCLQGVLGAARAAHLVQASSHQSMSQKKRGFPQVVLSVVLKQEEGEERGNVSRVVQGQFFTPMVFLCPKFSTLFAVPV